MWVSGELLKATFPVTDYEECGILIGSHGSVSRIIKVSNQARGNEEFLICSCELVRAKESLGPEERIVGFVHTHLPHHKASPSDTDFEGAELHPELEHLVYKPSTRQYKWYGLAEVLAL